MKLVIAGSRGQFLNYLRENNLTGEYARYVWKLEHLYGYGRDTEIVRTGEYWRNPINNDPCLSAYVQTKEQNHVK